VLAHGRSYDQSFSHPRFDPWIVELEEACPQASGGFMGYRCPLTACRSSPRGTYRHHPDYCRLQPRACRSNRCRLPQSTTSRNVTHCQWMRGAIIRSVALSRSAIPGELSLWRYIPLTQSFVALASFLGVGALLIAIRFHARRYRVVTR
jgi:hypothetical protein